MTAEQNVVVHFEGGVSPTDLLALAQPTPPDEIKWRADRALYGHQCPPKPQRCSEINDPAAHAQLAYVDARWVMERLDDIVGPANWTRKHLLGADGKVACGIGILVQGVGWVEKWDGAGETAIEGDKGSFSDAFKRAAVSWGLARDLYSLDKKAPPATLPRAATPPAVAAPQQNWAQQAASEIDADGPSCPDHGTQSLKPSKFGQGQFYCSGKGGSHPNPKGYCTWSTNPRAA